MTICELTDIPCGSVSAQTNVVILETSPYSITASETNALGYNEPLCFQCTITPTGLSPILFNHLLTIVADPLDCSVSLMKNEF